MGSGTEAVFSIEKDKGPAPFGVEPSASDFVMLPLLVCNVSIARLQFFHPGFLEQLHSTSTLETCLRGKTPGVRRFNYQGLGWSVQTFLSHLSPSPPTALNSHVTCNSISDLLLLKRRVIP